MTLPGGDVCPPSCDPKVLRVGTTVEISTQAPAGYVFEGWTGLCERQPNPCRISVPAYTAANVIGATYGRDRDVVISTACPKLAEHGVYNGVVATWWPPCSTGLCVTFDAYGANLKACDGGPGQTVQFTAAGQITKDGMCLCSSKGVYVYQQFASNSNGTACSAASCLWTAEPSGFLRAKATAYCVTYGESFNRTYWKLLAGGGCFTTFTVTQKP